LPAVSVPDRQLVASRFSGAADIYDEHAGHQVLIAAELLHMLESLEAETILELGCGTGILSEGLSRLFPMAYKVFSDAARGMVAVCRRRVPPSNLVQHTIWDFEDTRCDRSYDLVVSSCALQWLRSPERFMKKLASLVASGGHTVHAIPVTGMLHELESSFTCSGGTWNSLNYLHGNQWNALIEGSGFTVLDSATRTFTLRYGSPAESLRAVQRIGASLSGHFGAVEATPGEVRRAFQFYRNMFGDSCGTVPASYEIHFVRAVRN